jgi:threonyl-tRNA synthetase
MYAEVYIFFLKENMFQFECEKEKYALKPMNCPGHWYAMQIQ